MACKNLNIEEKAYNCFKQCLKREPTNSTFQAEKSYVEKYEVKIGRAKSFAEKYKEEMEREEAERKFLQQQQ